MTKKSTITKIGTEVNEIVKKTANKVAKIIGSTLGPYGSNCLNETSWGTHLTKDGASVLANLTFEDPFENAVLNVIKDAVFKSNALAGDGTTSTTILINEILNSTLKLVGLGYNGIQIRNGIRIAAEKVVSSGIAHPMMVHQKSFGGASQTRRLRRCYCVPRGINGLA